MATKNIESDEAKWLISFKDNSHILFYAGVRQMRLRIYHAKRSKKAFSMFLQKKREQSGKEGLKKGSFLIFEKILERKNLIEVF